MILIYYKGKGTWFDFPSVDSPERFNASIKWYKENPIPKGIWADKEEEWIKHEELRKKWDEDNPPPKFKVEEDKIILERVRLFDSFTPVLQYQPEKAFVHAVFKLKAIDERRLRYEGEVSINILITLYASRW